MASLYFKVVEVDCLIWATYAQGSSAPCRFPGGDEPSSLPITTSDDLRIFVKLLHATIVPCTIWAWFWSLLESRFGCYSSQWFHSPRHLREKFDIRPCTDRGCVSFSITPRRLSFKRNGVGVIGCSPIYERFLPGAKSLFCPLQSLNSPSLSSSPSPSASFLRLSTL